MPFGMGTSVGSVNRGGTHWRNLANTTEPSMYGGDGALCQITLPLVLFFVSAYHGSSNVWISWQSLTLFSSDGAHAACAA